jgi:hypothetical protein
MLYRLDNYNIPMNWPITDITSVLYQYYQLIIFQIGIIFKVVKYPAKDYF